MIQKTDFIEKINSYLNSCIPQSDIIQDGLAQSMRYSLLAGGKRIRPLLVLEFAAALGENPEKVLPVACAVEMIHTYSLIHDDLPCMDNDVLRRGKPTNHVVYGECTATLAGDALQPLAFETILSSELSAERAVRCARILAECIGMKGMCLGQYLDMLGEGKELTAEELDLINNNKTGALLAASCGIGTAAAGGSERQINAAMNFGYKIGLAFQIRDDILDVISTSEELGKNVGSDAEEKKNTYMVLLGREKCENEIKRLTEEAISVLEEEFRGFDISAPVELARSMENRKN
ncbi:MAG: polyprenyl synthetase family protein [Eubacteriales bacterium]|nr:polyprenyl synthetase family protein [Eubacteriales bacterium]